MTARLTAMLVLALASNACDTRGGPPGRPAANSEEVRPSEVLDFGVLYAANCAGCHGPDGRGGPAVGLGDPVYLALADDTHLRGVTSTGVPGTAMPAFARSAGGMLTEAQVEAVVKGMRARWARPDLLRGVDAPPLSSGGGDVGRGASAFAVYCASCHGDGGRGGSRASSIVDPSFLALVSDQGLRTTVIVGRPELGAPDWRGDLPGRPMSKEDVSDVVAWLTSHRVEFPGQPYPDAPAERRGER